MGVDSDLWAIDRSIDEDPDRPLCTWFATWDATRYARLYTADLTPYPSLAARLPGMPDADDQAHWTGSSGERSLHEGVVFQQLVKTAYERHTGESLMRATVLDYGAGWGRMTRLFLQYVPEEQMDAVDASPDSLEMFEGLGFGLPCLEVPRKPTTLPLAVAAYDLVFLYSVLTSLPFGHAEAILRALRPAIRDGGLLAITTRPRVFWEHNGLPDLRQELDRDGYAHLPTETDWGETSLSPRLIRASFPEWRVVGVDHGMLDWMQLIVFLEPG